MIQLSEEERQEILHLLIGEEDLEEGEEPTPLDIRGDDPKSRQPGSRQIASRGLSR